MTVAEMLSRISSKELTGWMVFYGLEPFGVGIPYIGNAITTSNLVNIQLKKGAKKTTAEDFMPKFEKPKQQTTDEMIGAARMLTAAMGGKDLTE